MTLQDNHNIPMEKHSSKELQQNAEAIDLEDQNLSTTPLIQAQRTNVFSRVAILWVLMALVVIATVVGISVAVTQASKADSHSTKTPPDGEFSFDDIFDLTPQSFSVDWFDGKSYTFLREDDDSLPSILRQEIDEPMPVPVALLDGSTLSNDIGTYSRFSTSFDQNRIMLPVNETKVWRHSFLADYMIYDVQELRLSPLTSGDPEIQQMGAIWSPADNKVAYVQSNNIFIRDVSSEDVSVQVTFDGSEAIINGIHNWVYEEEIYGSEFVSMWWAPDGERLAFIRSDESQVETFKFMEYSEDPYPDTVDVKYPTAGTMNPVVMTGIFYSSQQCTQFIDLDVIAPDEETYITMVFWIDDDTLALRLLDRLHRNERIYYTNLPATCSEDPLPAEAFRLVRQQTDRRYLERTSALQLVPGSNLLLDTMQNNGFNHIALTNTDDLTTTFLTAGDFEVTSIGGYHDESRRVFFYSTEVGPLERHLYSVNLDGVDKMKHTNFPGWWSGSFSPTSEFYLETFGGNGDLMQVPRYTLKSTTGQFNPLTMESNDELREELSQRAIPFKRYFSLPNPADPLGIDLNAYLIYPHDYDAQKRYPILVDIYGGPGSQTVTQQFDLGFDLYVASQGYIIASVDGRGTGARGLEFKKQTYGNLGTLETEDLIVFGQYLRDVLNPTSLAVWGWSYGGYMTSKVMQQDTDQVYDSGMIVAPVTSWYYYDTVYTERYMDTPQNNPDGYASTAVVGNVENFRNKNFVIVHGTGDDNVHFHNSIVLYTELIDAEIQFDSLIYPNEDHGIPSRRHLYRFLGDWLFRNSE